MAPKSENKPVAAQASVKPKSKRGTKSVESWKLYIHKVSFALSALTTAMTVSRCVYM